MCLRSSEGNITIVAVAITTVALMLALPVLWFGGLLLINNQLTQEADLVARATVSELVSDVPAPCEVAKQVAESNGVSLAKCRIDGGYAVVWVSTTVQYPIAGPIRRSLPNQLTAKSKAALVFKSD